MYYKRPATYGPMTFGCFHFAPGHLGPEHAATATSRHILGWTSHRSIATASTDGRRNSCLADFREMGRRAA
jgi:hypothetical protein